MRSMLMQSWPLLEVDAAARAGHGAPERRVGQHEQGVLAAQLHGAVLEALAA